MDIALQQLVAGLAIGCVYGLIALGFSITLVGADLVNFAQGELVMLGAFLGYTMITTLQLPFALTFVLTIILTGVFGVFFERVLGFQLSGCLKNARRAGVTSKSISR